MRYACFGVTAMPETPNNVAAFRRWLRAEIKWMNDPYPDEQQFYDAANAITKARRIAVGLGLPDVARICGTIRTPALALPVAQEVLADCLVATNKKKPSEANTKRLTPPQVAERYGVSPDTVRRWITNGDLPATDVGKGGRPRYKVSADNLKEFDKQRVAQASPAKPVKRRCSKDSDLLITRYSSRR